MDIRDEDIAVIGMAGRFPGANTLEAFWQNLQVGNETIKHFSDAELAQAGIDAALYNQANYVKAKGVVDQVEYFDAEFFGLSALEAQILDPQHRILLMCAVEAFENAGYVPKRYQERVGVFTSTGLSFYLLKNILSNQNFLQYADEYQILLGNDKDFLATRISYLLNLRGPSINIQTGCSSSLAALHYACQSILSGECEMALAGGVSITIPQEQGYLYRKEMIGSPDGHCYAFDKRAQGTVKSNGAGMVLLKPLKDALDDHDHIHAVIRGTAINNDGANKVGYTAPSVNQQAAVIQEALQIAEVKPEEVRYVETHGTGTLLGDPIEIAALTKAFSSAKTPNSCALTSLKSNIGHLDVAAGIAGFIKVCLALYHKQIPASLNFTELNPKINLENTPFYINTKLMPWPEQHKPIYAGVSAFGIGGTNIHVVLQNAPMQQTKAAVSEPLLFFISAKSSQALVNQCQDLLQHCQKRSQVNINDVAYTLQTGRETMPYRLSFTADSMDSLLKQLQNPVTPTAPVKTKAPVAFMFSGQGNQYLHMAQGLYQTNVDFRTAFDDCITALNPYLDADLRTIIFPEDGNKTLAEEALKQTVNTQPALFAVEYALAKALFAKGVQPCALLGHSIGEYTAAVIAGIFSLNDAARLIALRGKLIQSLPSGSMLAVFAELEKIKPLLNDHLDVALINATKLIVISGNHADIDTFAMQLAQLNIHHQRLKTSHAFHSQMLDPILNEFADIVASTQRHAPQIPIASNVTGKWLRAEEACSINYWVQQLRQTVHFADCIQTVAQDYAPIFLEIGPGRSLQNLVAYQGITNTFATLPTASEAALDVETYLATLGKLWQQGVVIKQEIIGNRIPLPHYHWDLKRYWIEPEPVTLLTKTDADSIQTQFDMRTAWQSVLGVERINDDDHFFNLGGSSLAAIQLINCLPHDLQAEVNVVHLYEFPKFSAFHQFTQNLSNQKVHVAKLNDDMIEQALFAANEEL